MGLEAELNALLEVERFEPPAEFRRQALLSDPAVYEEAAADPEAWWMRQATELLEWIEEPTQGLDDSNPPFYEWFADGRLNASANCLDRHVDAGLRKGQTAPIKAAVDEMMGDLATLETIVVVRHTGIDVPMTEGRDRFYD